MERLADGRGPRGFRAHLAVSSGQHRGAARAESVQDPQGVQGGAGLDAGARQREHRGARDLVFEQLAGEGRGGPSGRLGQVIARDAEVDRGLLHPGEKPGADRRKIERPRHPGA